MPTSPNSDHLALKCRGDGETRWCISGSWSRESRATYLTCLLYALVNSCFILLDICLWYDISRNLNIGPNRHCEKSKKTHGLLTTTTIFFLSQCLQIVYFSTEELNERETINSSCYSWKNKCRCSVDKCVVYFSDNRKTCEEKIILTKIKFELYIKSQKKLFFVPNRKIHS